MKSNDDIYKQRVMNLFNNGAHVCVHDVVQRAFIGERKARVILKEMHVAKATYICGWSRNGVRGRMAPKFALGEGVDLEKPIPLTEVERTSRYRRNIRKDMDRMDYMLDLRRTRARKIKADPVATSLFPWLYAGSRVEQNTETTEPIEMAEV